MQSETPLSPPFPSGSSPAPTSQVQGPLRDLALHTLGWKAFQDLCAQICEEVLKQTISIYREAQDGGQDAVFLTHAKGKEKVGTVQCKFSGDPGRHLREGDLTHEKPSIKVLVASGQAHTYCFITNMSVDGPIAVKIRATLRGLGVKKPHVMGKEWITWTIRRSPRLRALVPRVYGLGDLSIILDERRAEQTRALLGHLMPSLGVYVPTTAHRTAVRVLGEHGIVLLLGPPACGKSMLASILAASALDGDRHRCYKVDGPGELVAHWNPHERGGFYWVDDAFGPSQLRTDYVDHWLAIMTTVQTAIAAGNRFVLTSRSHIWNAAKIKLGMRNLPQFDKGKATVEVGSLSPEEAAQILYNHLKAGNQRARWKSIIKPHLDRIAKITRLLPEIARRLGDQSYTTGIKIIPDDLIRFIQEPTQFLKDTISELNDAQKAALTLVFLHRSKLIAEFQGNDSWPLVADKFGVTQPQIREALNELNGTFVVSKPELTHHLWSFLHPTIADAVAADLRQRPDLVELYLRGARVEAIVSEVVCEGTPLIRDAVVVPASLNELLVLRLMELPDEPSLNRSLFSFLQERASDSVLQSLLQLAPNISARESTHFWRCYHDPKICFHARIHALGLLTEGDRYETTNLIERALFARLDASFLDNDLILGLFQPTKLLQIAGRLGFEVIDSLPDQVADIVENANWDDDPSENFSDMRSFVNAMQELFLDYEAIQDKLSDLESEIDAGVEQISAKKDSSQVDWEGEDVSPRKVSAASGSRSIFSDVDD